MVVAAHPSAVSVQFLEEQPQILRLTTPILHPADEDLSAGAPELKDVWGPFRSG